VRAKREGNCIPTASRIGRVLHTLGMCRTFERAPPRDHVRFAARTVRTCKSLFQIHTPCSFPAEKFLAERLRLRSTRPATELSCGDQLSK